MNIFNKIQYFKKLSIFTAIFTLVAGLIISIPTIYAQIPTATPPGTVSPGGAPASYTLLEPLPCINGGGANEEEQNINCPPGTQKTSVNFEDYVQYVFNLLIALAAVAAVFMIVWGGFEYMTSEAPGVKSDGIKKATNAVYGLLLILSSYLILKTVDPRLVNIPSTLVKPLVINYNPNELSGFFQQLNQQIINDAKAYRGVFEQLANSNAAIQAQIDAKKSERQILCDKLITSYRMESSNDVSVSDCAQLLSNPSTLDPASQVIAAQVAAADNEVRNLQTKQDVNIAIGSMNANIQQCFGINTAAASFNNNLKTPEDCIRDINSISNNSWNVLKLEGAPNEAKRIANYGIYAKSMVNIYSNTLIITANDPYVKGAIDTVTTAVTTAGIAIGAGVGGGVGAVAGGIGATALINAPINAVWIAANQTSARTAIATIQQEVNNTQNQITDPDILAQYTSQAYNLIKSLGGKGDGTDSVVGAAPTRENAAIYYDAATGTLPPTMNVPDARQK